MKTRVAEILDRISMPMDWDYAWIHMAGGCSPYVEIVLFRGKPRKEKTFVTGNVIARVIFPYPAYTELGFKDGHTAVSGIPVKRSGNPEWMKAVYDRSGSLAIVKEGSDDQRNPILL